MILQLKEVGADFLTYNLKISKSKGQSNIVSFNDTDNDASFSKLVALVKSL